MTGFKNELNKHVITTKGHLYIKHRAINMDLSNVTSVKVEDKTIEYKYLEILENNEWENESWSFFIPYGPDVTAELIDQFENCLEETDHFSLVSEELSRENVDFLLDRNDIEPTSYKKRYNLKDACILTQVILSKFIENMNTEMIDTSCCGSKNKESGSSDNWYSKYKAAKKDFEKKNSLNFIKVLKAIKMAPIGQRYCELCDVYINRKNFSQHLKSLRHMKKEVNRGQILLGDQSQTSPAEIPIKGEKVLEQIKLSAGENARGEYPDTSESDIQHFIQQFHKSPNDLSLPCKCDRCMEVGEYISNPELDTLLDNHGESENGNQGEINEKCIDFKNVYDKIVLFPPNNSTDGNKMNVWNKVNEFSEKVNNLQQDYSIEEENKENIPPSNFPRSDSSGSSPHPSLTFVRQMNTHQCNKFGKGLPEYLKLSHCQEENFHFLGSRDERTNYNTLIKNDFIEMSDVVFLELRKYFQKIDNFFHSVENPGFEMADLDDIVIQASVESEEKLILILRIYARIIFDRLVNHLATLESNEVDIFQLPTDMIYQHQFLKLNIDQFDAQVCQLLDAEIRAFLSDSICKCAQYLREKKAISINKILDPISSSLFYIRAKEYLVVQIFKNMETDKYLEICEDNEWEGETWSFFVPYKNLSDKIISQLEEFLSDSDYFSLVSHGITRENIDYLLSRNNIENTWYMNRYNLLDECFLDNQILETFLATKDIETVEMEWDKGNIYIQAGQDNNGHMFVKELCALHFKNRFFLHSTYQLPEYLNDQTYIAKYDSANKWASKNYHQIAMADGVRPYRHIFFDLTRLRNQRTDGKMLIYVVGEEKARLLQNLFCGYENSRKIDNLKVLDNILIFDTIVNKSQRNLSHKDICNLSLGATAEERKQFLTEKFFCAKRDACIYHVSPNCAKLNCYYMLQKYYQHVNQVKSQVPTITDSEDEED
ncbi:unnamed protein product [Brugia timori]|uniref:U1-type domain-containing protein n=1 Tax=Brugia timori TaxID=42155 RepID=A0A0R3QSP7_9BILA|nr:unnamed protein product [Brugia timori]